VLLFSCPQYGQKPGQREQPHRWIAKQSEALEQPVCQAKYGFQNKPFSHFYDVFWSEFTYSTQMN